VCLALTLSALLGGAAQAALSTTYQDFFYTSVTSNPTADKPQSKLWFQDGAWWSLMLSPSDNVVHIFELRADHTWRDTGTVVDDRSNSMGDALWDGDANKLYVASRAASSPARLVRLSYSPTTRSYSVDAGFPVNISPGGSESITIAKDSTGKLWATFTRQSQVWVTHSTTSDTSWTAPFNPPVGDTAITSDDISSVVTMRGKIGVIWSDQLSQSFRFVTHVDGAPDTADGWGALEKPLAGTRLADDHINIKNIVSDDDGRLYAAIKTSLGDDPTDPSTGALVALLVRTNAGDWSSHTFGTLADDHTRPMVLLDETNRQIYLFATWPVGGGSIYYKTSPMNDISFPSGRGTEFMTWPGARIDDASSTKQPVNARSGIVVLASDRYAFRYYHSACLRVTAGRKRVKLRRRYGTLRLKPSKTTCLTKPILALVKPRTGTRLKTVRYKLDGKRLKRVKNVRFAAKLRPSKLSAGRHTLKVRVTKRTGNTKTFKVRLRTAVT
jgi:hypothetical protein